MDQFNFAVLVLRVVFGLFLAYHGYNKVFGGGGLSGTAGWFGSIGMRWPQWQARIAAATEIGAGVMMALGLLTPLAAVDLDGDGALEFVSGPDGESERFGLIRPGPKGTYVREVFFSVPFLDCPC